MAHQRPTRGPQRSLPGSSRQSQRLPERGQFHHHDLPDRRSDRRLQRKVNSISDVEEPENSGSVRRASSDAYFTTDCYSLIETAKTNERPGAVPLPAPSLRKAPTCRQRCPAQGPPAPISRSAKPDHPCLSLPSRQWLLKRGCLTASLATGTTKGISSSCPAADFPLTITAQPEQQSHDLGCRLAKHDSSTGGALALREPESVVPLRWHPKCG